MPGDHQTPPPGGGPGGGPPQHQPQLATTSLPTMTPERTGDGATDTPCRMRTFEEIIAQEKKRRNILTVKMTKIVKFFDGKEVKDKNLTMEDIGEFIFDILKVKIDECAGLSLSTSRYDTKEINLKPGIDPTTYLTKEPIIFKGHSITVTQQRIDTTKVTFKNVPWDIPDEELSTSARFMALQSTTESGMNPCQKPTGVSEDPTGQLR